MAETGEHFHDPPETFISGRPLSAQCPRDTRIHHRPRVAHQPSHGRSQARDALRCTDGESFSTRTRKFCGTRVIRITVTRSIHASIAKIAVGTMCAGWSEYSEAGGNDRVINHGGEYERVE
jgi:hypothetical protein